MNKKIANFSSNFLNKVIILFQSFSKKKLYLGIVFVFIIFGAALPLHPVYAFIDALADKIADAIAFVFAYTILWLGGFIVNAALFVLNQVLRTTFIGHSYTGLDNPIINVGWTLVRDLTNAIFVIILVFIGLATALRFKDYDVRKILLSLLIAMLLINFSPVMCGVVVDASNIVMNFFLQKVEGLTNLGRILSAQQSVIAQTLKRGAIIVGIPFALMQVFLLLFFNLLASIIILLFAALFAIRYVIIWILVILSPIAFAAYILPATKGYFYQWRNQFIQWCIIGIPAAFFLYLGNHMMIEAPRMISVSPAVEGGILDRPTIEMITVLMPYGIAIAFLWFGLFFAMATSATGANAVIGLAQKGARTTVKWTEKKGRDWLREKEGETRDWTREKITGSEKVQRFAQRMAQTPTWGEGEAGVGGFLKRRVSGPFAGATREIGRALGPEQIEKERSLAQEKEKESAGKTVAFQLAAFRKASTNAERIGALNAIVKDNNLDDAIDAGLTDKEVAKTRTDAETYDAHKEIVSARPDLERPIVNNIATRRGISPARAYSESIPGEPDSGIISKIRPHRAGYVSRSVFKDPVVMEAIVRSWDGRHIGKFIESHGREGVKAIEKAITDAPPNGLGGMLQLQKINSQLYQFIRNTAGQRLGFSII